MEGLLGYTFKDRQVLLEACTHASWQDGSPSYQRLEFLGDAVLDLFVTKTLAEKYPLVTLLLHFQTLMYGRPKFGWLEHR